MERSRYIRIHLGKLFNFFASSHKGRPVENILPLSSKLGGILKKFGPPTVVHSNINFSGSRTKSDVTVSVSNSSRVYVILMCSSSSISLIITSSLLSALCPALNSMSSLRSSLVILLVPVAKSQITVGVFYLSMNATDKSSLVVSYLFSLHLSCILLI